MKKLLLTTLGIVAGLGAFAQLPVSTSPAHKNVVLEELTGKTCQYCPDGHKIAAQIQANNPGRVMLLNIHTGSYAAGTPNYRTTWGDYVGGLFTVTGYPTGAINRTDFGAGVMHSRSNWNANTNTTLAVASPVNVGGAGTIDVSTRQLTLNVEAYYTAAGPGSSNKIHVVITQNNIEGPQTGGATYNPAQVLPNGNYNHMHMVRATLTPNAGDNIATISSGTDYTNSYNYTIPTSINSIPVELGDLQVAVYVSEGTSTGKIISGDYADITFTGLSIANNAKVKSVTSDNVVCGSVVTPTVAFQNYGNTVINTATISYNVNGGTPQTFPWSGSLASLANTSVDLNPISFTDIGNNTINVTITDVNGGADGDPGDNSGTKTNLTNTTSTGTGTLYELIVTQDQYGSEITWEIIDDATGNPVPGGTGGPYSDLGGSGVLAHNHNITLSSTGCYTFTINDSYGDGINAGYGAGNIRFEDNNNVAIFINNGTYSSSDVEKFEITSLTGISEANDMSDLSVYPNPTNSVATISFSLAEATSVKMEVFNAVGSMIYTNGSETMNVGTQKLNFDGSKLPNGIYMINLTIGEQLITKKVSILK